MSLLDLIAGRLKGQKNSLISEKSKKRIINSIDVTAPEDRVKMEMSNLTSAVDRALYRQRPDRRDLVTIYKNTMTDPHVFSQVEVAKAKLVGERFLISRGGVDDDEATGIFKKPWFEQFLKICFDSLLWGYTLVEFGHVVNGSWVGVDVFPRRHVEPFSKQILIRPGDLNGIPYGLKPEALYLLEIGKPEDLGSLQIISREVIWKTFSRTDWSQASEKFGMPLLYVKTATDDEKELDRIEEMCRTFGSNGYIITDIDDDITVVESKSSDFYKIYEMNVRLCDQQISKCINGQTGTSDEKSFVGSAEVHERILDDLHAARLRSISNIVIYSLFPFLQYHGYELDECQFRFPTLDDSPEEVSPEPYPVRPGQQPVGAGQKKKPDSHLTLPDWVINMQMG